MSISWYLPEEDLKVNLPASAESLRVRDQPWFLLKFLFRALFTLLISSFELLLSLIRDQVDSEVGWALTSLAEWKPAPCYSSDLPAVSSWLVSSETGELLSDRCIHAFILYLPGTINSLGVGIGERWFCWSDKTMITEEDVAREVHQLHSKFLGFICTTGKLCSEPLCVSVSVSIICCLQVKKKKVWNTIPLKAQGKQRNPMYNIGRNQLTGYPKLFIWYQFQPSSHENKAMSWERLKCNKEENFGAPEATRFTRQHSGGNTWLRMPLDCLFVKLPATTWALTDQLTGYP